MYRHFGISNYDIALFAGLIYLPWVLRPLWSPLVDIYGSKREWIYKMQLVISICLACIAFLIPLPDFFHFSMVLWFIIAFASATHDAAVDGFYVGALTHPSRSFFIGVRSVFYKVSFFAAQGLLIVMAGYLEIFFTVAPTEFKVSADPNRYFSEEVNLDLFKYKSFPGQLRIIASKNDIKIGAELKTAEDIYSYREYVRNFNMVNGFAHEFSEQNKYPLLPREPVGNIGIVGLHLSKQPAEEKEYSVIVEQKDINDNIKIVEGGKLKFNSKNWNKPALVLVQINPALTKKTETLFNVRTEKVFIAWIIPFIAGAVLFFALFVYHRKILPYPVSDRHTTLNRTLSFNKLFFKPFFRFFEKKRIGVTVIFLVFFLFAEGQLVKTSSMFLTDKRVLGGLGLSVENLNMITALIYTPGFILGSLLGGLILSRSSLKKWILPMMLAVNIPPVIYAFLAFTQPTDIIIIYSAAFAHYLYYGFGITGYILYMVNLSDGDFKASHYSIAASFMTLGMMLSGIISEPILKSVDYKYFFSILPVMVIPSLIILKYLPSENIHRKVKEV
jgi:PAT family beta-lactamase induction signal transducer AmpG